MKAGILCSGVALGVYVPGIYIYHQLKDAGILSDIFVLENLLPDDKIDKIQDNKLAFHRNFSIARLGQKMAQDILPGAAKDKMEKLFHIWNSANTRYFVVLSGFWLSILNEYRMRFPQDGIKIECLHIDSVPSVSWKKAASYDHALNHNWLVNYENRRIEAELISSGTSPVPYHKRQRRMLVHGGGWGMGTYLARMPEIRSAGVPLNVLVLDQSEVCETEHDRFYMTDPNWSPWLSNPDGEYTFPPTGRLKENGELEILVTEREHSLLSLSKDVLAIISKPGGATLLDALAAATPIIFLEPFGDHEEKNAELFIRLGFGIDYEQWKKSGFDMEVIERLHQNLLKTIGRFPLYTEGLMERIRKAQNATQDKS